MSCHWDLGSPPLSLIVAVMQFNALSKKSSAFGVHPWHWYWTQGLPAIVGTQVCGCQLPRSGCPNKPQSLCEAEWHVSRCGAMALHHGTAFQARGFGLYFTVFK